jgi:hypothetical protein
MTLYAAPHSQLARLRRSDARVADAFLSRFAHARGLVGGPLPPSGQRLEIE